MTENPQWNLLPINETKRGKENEKKSFPMLLSSVACEEKWNVNAFNSNKSDKWNVYLKLQPIKKLSVRKRCWDFWKILEKIKERIKRKKKTKLFPTYASVNHHATNQPIGFDNWNISEKLVKNIKR